MADVLISGVWAPGEAAQTMLRRGPRTTNGPNLIFRGFEFKSF